MDMKKSSMSSQNRLILVGFLACTTVIVLIAILATNAIQNNMNMAYKSFGQIIAKTLAIESVEVTKDIPEANKYNTLRSHSLSILKSNDDISFIEFKDNKSKVIYSSKDDFPKAFDGSIIAVSSPMVNKSLVSNQVVGSVTIGLSGNIIDKISGTTRASLLLVFIITWIVFAAVVIVNTLLITKELRHILTGVRKISSGEFGYKLEGTDVSSDVQELFTSFNDMSQKLHQFEEQNIEELTLEKNKLEAVLMSIANGVVVCDNYDKIVLINNHARKLLEAEQSEILGTKIQQYCDTNGELCFKEKIEQFKDTPLDVIEKRPLGFNIEVDKRIIKCVVSPMFSRNKDYVGYIIVLIDITKEIEMDNLRNHFISNVSHELRTPVTVLRSYIDTLYNYGNDFDFNTQKEFIGVMNQEIIRLNRMVNDILDFSRYQSQQIRLEKKKEDVTKIIEECVNQLDILAHEHKITISVMKEPDLPEVPLNHDSIARVINNILSNAIKYSPDGSRVKIRAERARVGDFIEVSVEDQGPGIPEEYQKKIFDRFFRVENATHSIKGTGLGLHLVKISVEKHHGGEVFVHSKVGEGSTFGFRLPINPKDDSKDEMPEKNQEEDLV